MAYFPLYIDIENKKCVVIGGGRVAARKIGQLLSFGAAVTVIAPKVTEEIRRMSEDGRIRLLRNALFQEAPEVCEAARTGTDRKADLSGTDWKILAELGESTLVVAATGRTEVNVRVSEFCRSKGIPVNVVDVKELSTFFFPAIVRREELVVAVSTSGTSPALAAKMRRELEQEIPETYGKVSSVMGAYREYIKDRAADIEDRKQIFELLLEYALSEESTEKADVDRIISKVVESRGQHGTI